MPLEPQGPRQRRMWVLPAPKGGLDKSDRYEIGIFYALRFFVAEVILPLRVMFTSTAKPDVFVSEKTSNFLSDAAGFPHGGISDASTKKPSVFKSLWEKNIFTSIRKQRKSN